MATTKTPRTPDIAAELLIGQLVDSATGCTLPDGLRLTFSHGASIELRVTELSPSIIMQATLHGLKQKLVDAAAISRDPETGRAATIETKFGAVREVFQRLLAGEWNKTREGGGATGGILLRALMRMQPTKTRDALTAWLEPKTDKEKAALRANPRIATIIETIKSEDAARKGDDAAAIDTDAMLNELGE